MPRQILFATGVRCYLSVGLSLIEGEAKARRNLKMLTI